MCVYIYIYIDIYHVQVVEVLENPQKERRLLELLKKNKPSTTTNKVLVFALYKKEAERVYQMLKGQGYE